MYTRPLPPLDVLRQLLSYDPDSGLLTWLPRPVEMFEGAKKGRAANICAVWNARYAGAAALNRISALGYKVGKVGGASYQAHRIIWLLHTGEQPEFIDHINGKKDDNRFANLRSVTWQENARNRSRPANNTSGVVGVHWCATNKKWVAQIRPEGVATQRSAYFRTKEEAVAARKAAEASLGFHENHGR